MNMKEFTIDKILEIYEYYDGPISRLVLLKNGKKALVELHDFCHKTKKVSELLIELSEEELNELKTKCPPLKQFYSKMASQEKVYLLTIKDEEFNSKKLTSEEVVSLLVQMSDDLKFEDNSECYKDYC